MSHNVDTLSVIGGIGFATGIIGTIFVTSNGWWVPAIVAVFIIGCIALLISVFITDAAVLVLAAAGMFVYCVIDYIWPEEKKP